MRFIEYRLASWAEEDGVKARGQVGFRKNHRTNDDLFVLRSLIDKPKQCRQRSGRGNCTVALLLSGNFFKAFDNIPRAVL